MTLDGFAEFPNYPGSDVVSEKPGIGFTDMWVNQNGTWQCVASQSTLTSH